MKPFTAFERMRAQRERRAQLAKAKEQMRQQLEQWGTLHKLEEQQREQENRWQQEQIDREHKETMDKAMFDLGMAAWGADLTACLFHPKPHKVPMPPIYGGEPYKMMKMEAP